MKLYEFFIGDIGMSKKALTLAYWLTNLFALALIACTVTLPWFVTWYVETKGRSQSLPAIIMVTCYPCVPFAAGVLLYLRRIIKNVAKDMLFHEANVVCFKRIAFFCMMISIITLIAGRFYVPFLIMGISFGFFAFLVFVIKTVYAEISNKIDKNVDKQ